MLDDKNFKRIEKNEWGSLNSYYSPIRIYPPSSICCCNRSIFMSPTESNKTENPSCFAQRNIFPIIYSLSKII